MKRLWYADVYTNDIFFNRAYHERISSIMAEDSKEAAQILRDKLSRKPLFGMEYLTESYKYLYYREVDGDMFLKGMYIDKEEYDNDYTKYQNIRLYESFLYPIRDILVKNIIKDLRENPINKAIKAQGLQIGSYYEVTFFNNATKLDRYETHYSLDEKGEIVATTSRREYMDYLPIAELNKFEIGDIVHIIYDELNIDFVVSGLPKSWFEDENWENMYTLYAKDGDVNSIIKVHEKELVKADKGEQ